MKQKKLKKKNKSKNRTLNGRSFIHWFLSFHEPHFGNVMKNRKEKPIAKNNECRILYFYWCQWILTPLANTKKAMRKEETTKWKTHDKKIRRRNNRQRNEFQNFKLQKNVIWSIFMTIETCQFFFRSLLLLLFLSICLLYSQNVHVLRQIFFFFLLIFTTQFDRQNWTFPLLIMFLVAEPLLIGKMSRLKWTDEKTQIVIT